MLEDLAVAFSKQLPHHSFPIIRREGEFSAATLVFAKEKNAELAVRGDVAYVMDIKLTAWKKIDEAEQSRTYTLVFT